MARKRLPRVQVKGGPLCFLPAGPLPGAHRRILLTAGPRHTLGSGSSQVAAAWRRQEGSGSGSLWFPIRSPRYGKSTCSCRHCSRRSISAATQLVLALRSSSTSSRGWHKTDRNGRTRGASVCSLSPLFWSPGWACRGQGPHHKPRAAGTSRQGLLRSMLGPRHLAHSTCSINHC